MTTSVNIYEKETLLGGIDKRIESFQNTTYISFVKEEISVILANIRAWMDETGKLQRQESTSGALGNDIRTIVDGILEEESLTDSQLLVLQQVRKILSSTERGRSLTSLDIGGETFDVGLSLLKHFSYFTVTTSVISLAHKWGFLRRHLNKLDSLLQEKFPHIQQSKFKPEYKEEAIEIIQSLLVWGLAVIASFGAMVEFGFTMRTRRRHTNIEIDMYEMTQKIVLAFEKENPKKSI